MRREENEADRVDGLLMITRRWFDRSLHSAVMDGYWTKHPTFEAYVAMMIPPGNHGFGDGCHTGSTFWANTGDDIQGANLLVSALTFDAAGRYAI